MPTKTPRLGLWRHTTADRFKLQDYTDNWQALDAAPGIHVVTSASRPLTWGSAHLGQVIYESDTRLFWTWTGSGWVRLIPRGHIVSSETTAPYTTTATAYSSAVVAVAQVYDGNRPHLVIAEGPAVKNTNGMTELALFRDTTQLQAWSQYGGTGTSAVERPRPLFAMAVDTPTPGSYGYRLNVRVAQDILGTSTLEAAIDRPLALHVVEL